MAMYSDIELPESHFTGTAKQTFNFEATSKDLRRLSLVEITKN